VCDAHSRTSSQTFRLLGFSHSDASLVRNGTNRQWDEKSLGWHEDHVHDAIVKYGDRIIPGWSTASSTDTNANNACAAPSQAEPVTAGTWTGAAAGARVFFPLCGKTLDMAAVSGHPSVSQVVGVDGIRTALDEFAKEHPHLKIREDLDDAAGDPTSVAPRRYDRLVGDKMLLLKGDFFDLDEIATDGSFDAVFDRASLVAIDPTLRSDYVQVMSKLIRPGGKILLVVIERMSGNEDEDKTAGPPFSVPEAQVRALYETQEWVKAVTLLEEMEPEIDRKMRSVYYLVETETV
jgi:thiopurine S-methyltransferase